MLGILIVVVQITTRDCGLFDATKGLSTPIEICMGDDTCYDVKSCGDVPLHFSNDMSKK